MFFIKSRRKSTIFFGNHKIKIYFILIGKKIESIFEWQTTVNSLPWTVVIKFVFLHLNQHIDSSFH
jgi:hypothetical protein